MLHNLLQKRKHTYYFRWKLPTEISVIVKKTELIRTLDTSNKACAIFRARFLALKVNEIKSLRSSFKMQNISSVEYDRLVKKIWNEMLSNKSISSAYENLNSLSTERLKDDAKSLQTLINDIQHLSYDSISSLAKISNEIELDYFLHKENSPIDRHDIAYKELLLEHANACLQLIIVVNSKLWPESPTLSIPSHIDLSTEAKATIQQYRHTQKTATHQTNYSDIKLSDAWGLYLNDKLDPITGDWIKYSPKEVENKKLVFRDFIWALEQDKNVDDFTREDAKKIHHFFSKFPANREKNFKNLSPSEIPKTAKQLSKTTAANKLVTIKSFFVWLIDEEHFSSKNPFNKLTIKFEKIPYAAYSAEQMQLLLALDKNKSKLTWRYWIPRIALYTGARQNEIAQLRTSDVIKDANTGIYYFQIDDEEEWQTVKNKNARRIVPISSALIENGFLEYHKSITNYERLWPDLAKKAGKYGQTVSEWWGLHYKQEPTEKGNRYVFHSIRKTTATAFLNSKPPLMERIIQELIGHEPEILGETEGYYNGSELVTLKEYIERLHFDIEWLPYDYWKTLRINKVHP